MRTRFISALATLLVLPLGCDPYGEAIVTVVVPVELQTALADEFPFQVVVQEDGRPCVRAIEVVCASSDADVLFEWLEGSVCPGPSEARFFAVPVPPAEVDGLTCGTQPPRGPCVSSDVLEMPLTEEAVVPLFRRGDCNEGTETHRVVLEAREGG